MIGASRTREVVAAALKVVSETEATAIEKVEMLMEVAAGLQQKPRSTHDLDAAVSLYHTSLDLCPETEHLLRARLRARLATALMALPGSDIAPLRAACEALRLALPVLASDGLPAETAEAEMNFGLALQTLAAHGAARIQDAIGAYQRALRVFDRMSHPREFAILQNNLATAFLSISISGERGRLSEALAVQAFEEGLAVITFVDHPKEYAMLQNNLGNALQSVSSAHPLENRYRALDAYEEALKVRDPRNSPGEYANTIANKASCLANLPDNPDAADDGNTCNLRAALTLYRQAEEIFITTGEDGKAANVAAAIAEIEADLTACTPLG